MTCVTTLTSSLDSNRAYVSSGLWTSNVSSGLWTSKPIATAVPKLGVGLEAGGRLRRKGPTDPDDEYLTTAEAARLLGVSPPTVNRWANQGRIPYTVTLGGHRRFARSVVEQTRALMQGNAQ